MPAPSPYAPSYSFSGYQAADPTHPLPAPRLDDELARVALASSRASAAINDVRRADGALVNGIVTVDSLAPDILTGLPRPTVWATATEYAEGDLVFVGAVLGFCEIAHTSTVYATDRAAGKWVDLADFTPVDIVAAASVTFDPTGTELTASNVQTALQEVASGEIETVADLAASNIPAARKTILVAGHTTPGIGRINLVRSLVATPLQSLDGAYWARTDDTFSIDQFGGDPNFALISDGALQDAVDAMADYRGGLGGTVYVPGGKYKLAATVTLPKNVALVLGRYATLVASEEMVAMIDTPLGTANRHEDGLIEGGVLDCALLADRAARLQEYSGFRLLGTKFYDYNVVAVQAGSTDADAGSYKLITRDCEGRRRGYDELPDGVSGIDFEASTDNEIWSTTFVGVRYGFGGSGCSDTNYYGCHVWNAEEHGDVYAGFYLDSYDNRLIGCSVDGPCADGVRVVRGNHVIEGFKLNVGSYGGIADHSVGVRVAEDAVDTTQVNVVNSIFKGASGYELSADIAGDLTKVYARGNQTRWSNTIVGDLDPE